MWFKGRSISADTSDKVYTHWEQDYNLADQPKLGLFDEYLEMGNSALSNYLDRSLILVAISDCYHRVETLTLNPLPYNSTF